MRVRPLILFLLCLSYLLVALSFPLQIMFLHEHSFDELPEVVAKLTTLNWLVVGGCLICAVLVIEASPLLVVAAPVVVLLVAANNYAVGNANIDYSPELTFLATVCFAGMNLPLLLPKVRSLLLQPERRWWRTAERHRVAVPIRIEGSETLEGLTFDISETGVFVPLSGNRNQIHALTIVDAVTLTIQAGKGDPIRCDGRIVRRGQARGVYPAGVGIEFQNLTSAKRRELRAYLKKQNEMLDL